MNDPIASSDISRIAYGGKRLYGARVGILMLETSFPRIPGDMGNGSTWPFPVLYKVVPGATPDRVVRHKSQGLVNAFLDAAAELVHLGADGITTTCGFLSLYQKELAAHVRVPVAASSLMQIPLVERILPPGKRVGVLTVSAASLTPEHFLAAGANPETPVVGTDNGREFTKVMLDEKHTLDAALAERDILDAGDALVAAHPDIGAIVLECTNMTPYARALGDHLLLPVYSIYSFVAWFHAGLAPRDFGPPGSGARQWRER
ncbi:MAG TPA: aspartate/glutamate racemase family protein [Stellaceae bacterium]|nr:aspartate/glutamate racemase family protein [Stellaceae bacterium]